MTSSAYSTLEDASERGDVVRFWREPRYGGLECLSATFRRHRYALHTHETYAIAAVLEGCETFMHRGVRRYVDSGGLAVVCPDELHDGEPAGESFVYRTLYPSVELMRSVAEDAGGRPVTGTPNFPGAVVDDRALNVEMAALHASLSDRRVSELEQDTRLQAFLTRLMRRHGVLGEAPSVGNESAGVRRARAFIDASYAEEIPLETVAALAGLSRSHLVRAFRKEIGTTPHAYQIDRRFRAAARLIGGGAGVAEAAALCGFFDQSHLNRVFKARMGVTPGTFAAQR